ncbi:hypothetical protein L249_0070 [Ophiocordyceps polyrhachis-furcata BCC 54312]|uniref:Uncharacterized protein n=1 Tax=Ophiocordyceps polyrhachis-furcata BCC 54312 TaxID=1330021 RepID=A0A367LFL7_9HYPO|nr:hypothetical protein L249_0070 [Ophiocordyceps polyrhachis-furcata BCC 54312]
MLYLGHRLCRFQAYTRRFPTVLALLILLAGLARLPRPDRQRCRPLLNRDGVGDVFRVDLWFLAAFVKLVGVLLLFLSDHETSFFFFQSLKSPGRGFAMTMATRAKRDTRVNFMFASTKLFSSSFLATSKQEVIIRKHDYNRQEAVSNQKVKDGVPSLLVFLKERFSKLMFPIVGILQFVLVEIRQTSARLRSHIYALSEPKEEGK